MMLHQIMSIKRVTDFMCSQQALFYNRTANWSAVFSLFVGVTSLVAAEFIPISLLTPIARDLAITEGMAGQTVTVVGIFAVLTSLLLAPLTKGVNRRHILLAFSSMLLVSNILVAVAPNYPIMLIGRGLLGICVGGFWSMSAAVTLQLVPINYVPRALSIIYAGVAGATIISLPVASYFGHLLGWRNVFYLEALLGGVGLVWQFVSLPSLSSDKSNDFRGMLRLFRQDWVLLGILATIFSFGGYNVFFTYLRPFLELDLFLRPNTLSIVLGVFGVANCVGTFAAGLLFNRQFRSCMILLQGVLAVVAVLLYLTDGFLRASIPLVVLWGFLWGFMPVGWSSWITRTLADRAEMAGGLSVASIQFSIGGAAAIGGFIFDRSGIQGIFLAAAGFLVIASILIKVSFSLYAKDTGRLA
ncbi:MFS transporter [Solidesulfovibrio magneticus]|uniref:Major facilitator superfamily protein n=1 Tax=Solidesulfovibrio magneticus (strain ATCC 700980 / DSM 13731 / RS-1) TaxID=573370 RepID=C4XTW0_SOLM1|nr:MFS transporter [Solidesulfovibrio magneticus]BAH73625.1 major facilitator superfamily protein [Solidesulfovibrio magneticus RS-1]